MVIIKESFDQAYGQTWTSGQEGSLGRWLTFAAIVPDKKVGPRFKVIAANLIICIIGDDREIKIDCHDKVDDESTHQMTKMPNQRH